MKGRELTPDGPVGDKESVVLFIPYRGRDLMDEVAVMKEGERGCLQLSWHQFVGASITVGPI